jgi:signal peptidase I
LLKRVLGLGGDEMVFGNGAIHINDQSLEREPLNVQDTKQNNEELTSTAVEFLEFSQPLQLRGHRIFMNHEPDRSFFDSGRITVPPGSLFLLGDNRDLSEDSRNFGTIPAANILGKAWLILSRAHPGPNEGTYLQKIDP